MLVCPPKLLNINFNFSTDQGKAPDILQPIHVWTRKADFALVYAVLNFSLFLADASDKSAEYKRKKK